MGRLPSPNGRGPAAPGGVSPDGRHHYLTGDRSFADEPLEAALSTRERNAPLDGPGDGLGDTSRVPMAAVFERLGRTPR